MPVFGLAVAVAAADVNESLIIVFDLVVVAAAALPVADISLGDTATISTSQCTIRSTFASHGPSPSAEDVVELAASTCTRGWSDTSTGTSAATVTAVVGRGVLLADGGAVKASCPPGC